MPDPKPPLAPPPFAVLGWFERYAFRLVRFFNQGTGARLGALWQQHMLEPFVLRFVSRRLQVHGLEQLQGLPAGAPILLVSNHRTFFDQFVIATLLQRAPGQRRRCSFPVRANFFYENPVGLLICMVLSGGSMFPPFFRSAEKMPFNKFGLALLIDKLRGPGQLVGFHPEGKRNQGPDPYELLPAQPGAGELALKARPLVVPAFVSGLSNGVFAELKANLRGVRPVLVVFGAPVDLSAFPAETRLSHHKRCADLLALRIRELGQEEKALRNQLPPPAA